MVASGSSRTRHGFTPLNGYTTTATVARRGDADPPSRWRRLLGLGLGPFRLLSFLTRALPAPVSVRAVLVRRAGRAPGARAGGPGLGVLLFIFTQADRRACARRSAGRCRAGAAVAMEEEGEQSRRKRIYTGGTYCRGDRLGRSPLDTRRRIHRLVLSPSRQRQRLLLSPPRRQTEAEAPSCQKRRLRRRRRRLRRRLRRRRRSPEARAFLGLLRRPRRRGGRRSPEVLVGARPRRGSWCRQSSASSSASSASSSSPSSSSPSSSASSSSASSSASSSVLGGARRPPKASGGSRRLSTAPGTVFSARPRRHPPPPSASRRPSSAEPLERRKLIALGKDSAAAAVARRRRRRRSRRSPPSSPSRSVRRFEDPEALGCLWSAFGGPPKGSASPRAPLEILVETTPRRGTRPIFDGDSRPRSSLPPSESKRPEPLNHPAKKSRAINHSLPPEAGPSIARS